MAGTHKSGGLDVGVWMDNSLKWLSFVKTWSKNSICLTFATAIIFLRITRYLLNLGSNIGMLMPLTYLTSEVGG